MKETQTNVTVNSRFGGAITLILATLTSMVGYHIHQSLFWAVMDFLFYPFAWVKWLIYHEVSQQVLRETFSWFFS